MGLIAVISCSFIVGDREALSDEKVFEQRPKGSEEQPGHLREAFQAGGNGKCKSPEEGISQGAARRLCSKSRVSDRSNRKCCNFRHSQIGHRV